MMSIQKFTAFIILVVSAFFMMSIQINAVAWEDTLNGVPILLSNCFDGHLPDDPNIHVELMVLRSDFKESQINDVIRDSYQEYYPNYSMYTHLDSGDEISYFAYIKGASMRRNECVYEYAFYQDEATSITQVRLIMFNSEGEILSSSPLYVHIHPDHFSNIRGFYRADFENRSFSNDRVLTFNHWIIFELILLVFLVFVVTLVKFGLGIPLNIKYHYPILSWVIDFLIVMVSISFVYYLYYVPEIRELLTLFFIVLGFLILQFVIGYFFLIKKESRDGIWTQSTLFFILIVGLLKLMV